MRTTKTASVKLQKTAWEFCDCGADKYICQVCHRDLCSRDYPSQWRPDITGNESAANVCPDCQKKPKTASEQPSKEEMAAAIVAVIRQHGRGTDVISGSRQVQQIIEATWGERADYRVGAKGIFCGDDGEWHTWAEEVEWLASEEVSDEALSEAYTLAQGLLGKKTAANLGDTLNDASNRDMQNSEEYKRLSEMPIDPQAQVALQEMSDMEGQVATKGQEVIDMLTEQTASRKLQKRASYNIEFDESVSYKELLSKVAPYGIVPSKESSHVRGRGWEAAYIEDAHGDSLSLNLSDGLVMSATVFSAADVDYICKVIAATTGIGLTDEEGYVVGNPSRKAPSVRKPLPVREPMVGGGEYGGVALYDERGKEEMSMSPETAERSLKQVHQLIDQGYSEDEAISIYLKEHSHPDFDSSDEKFLRALLKRTEGTRQTSSQRTASIKLASGEESYWLTQQSASRKLAAAMAVEFPGSYKTAAEDPLAANEVKAPPAATFKEYKKRPEDVPAMNVKHAPEAPPEVYDVYHTIQQANEQLNRISSIVMGAQKKLMEEISRVEQNMGKSEEIEKRQAAYNKLARLLALAENKTLNLGEKALVLIDEQKDKPYNPTPQWKLEKLIEKFDGAQEYLDKAIQGAQSLATKETVYQIQEFPNAPSKKAAMGIDVVDELIDALTSYIGSLQGV